MHDYSAFLPFALILGVVYSAAVGGYVLSTRRLHRQQAADNLALAVRRHDNRARHIGPRSHKYGYSNRDDNGQSNRDSHSNRHGYRNRHPNRAALGTV